MKESLLLFSSFEKSFILYPETFACSSLINKHNIAREKPCALEDKPWGQPELQINMGNLVSAKFTQSFAIADVGRLARAEMTKLLNPRILRHSCVNNCEHLSNACEKSQLNKSSFLLKRLEFSIKHFRVIIPSKVPKPFLYAFIYPGTILLLWRELTILLTMAMSAVLRTTEIKLIGLYFFTQSFLLCSFSMKIIFLFIISLPWHLPFKISSLVALRKSLGTLAYKCLRSDPVTPSIPGAASLLIFFMARSSSPRVQWLPLIYL